MDIPKFSSYSRTEAFEGLHKGAGPGEMTAQGSRRVFDTSWQPSASGDKASRLEALYHDLTERLVQVEKEISNKRVWSDSVDTRLQFLESCHRQHAASDHYKMQQTSNPDPSYQEGHGSCQEAFPRGVTQKELQEKEEYKKLKEKIKELEARNKELLSKAMGMHKHSENMNDPLRLSAVLQMYEMLRLHDWEKLRSSRASYLSYKTGSSIIKENTKTVHLEGQDRDEAIISIGCDDKAPQMLKNGLQHANSLVKQFISQKLFDACENDIQQRTTNIFEVLAIPPSNDAMINSKEGMMQKIRNLFRYSYDQNHSEFYSKIVMDPPVKAVWNLQESSMQYLEHVDKKDWEHWGKPEFLWPVMKCEEQVIVKGVIWDEK